MFIDSYSDTIQSHKNLPLLWCNDFSFGVAIDEPPLRGHKIFMKRKTDFEKIIGKKFGALTIIKEVTKNGDYRRTIEVECDCGNKKILRLDSVHSGNIKSCGCMKGIIHGLSYHRLYSIHLQIVSRCADKKDKLYGGRGISICDEWKNDVTVFYKWAILNGYEDHLSIDRINNNGNYEPSNCRWTTNKVQSRNRRTNIHITFNGETKLAIEWAEQLGITSQTLTKRRKRGWSIEKCLTTPNLYDGKNNKGRK